MNKNEIITRLEGTLDEMFHDFQSDLNIESGDLSPELARNLDEAIEQLANVIHSCMIWQNRNCPYFVYEQTYAPDTDTTFILKNTYPHWDGDLSKREVVSFYSGRPNVEDFKTYKSAGTVAEY